MKPIIFILAGFLFCTSVAAQAPIIAYSPTSNSLTAGVPVYLSPTNTGGPVPPTVYGTVKTFVATVAGPPALLSDMEAVAIDAAGNIYVAEYNGNDIKKITPAGVVTPYINGGGFPVALNGPDGLAVDGSGNLYIANYQTGTIKMVTPAGIATTFATGLQGPAGMNFDAGGNLWVAEQDGNTISKISPTKIVTEIAGDFNNNVSGYFDGTGSGALFNAPIDVQVDPSTQNIIVADFSNSAVRQMTQAGVVTTIAGGAYGATDGTGTGASFSDVTGVVTGSGNVIYVCDHSNNLIRRILPVGVVKTIAGSMGITSTDDGVGTAAHFNHAVDMVIDGSGNGYFIDGISDNIRKIILTGYTIDQPLPAGLTFDVTTGIISGTPAAFPMTTYTITGYNASGYSTTTITLKCTAPIINNWTGGTTDWALGTNWSQGHAPDLTETVEIGVSPYGPGTSQPTITNTPATPIQSLIFGTNNSPVLTINANQSLTVSNGVTVNASSSGTVAGPGTINLSGNTNILPTGSLTVTSNAIISLGTSSTLTNNGTFTLTADTNGAAAIAPLPPSSSIHGPVSVQQYLTGGVGYRGFRLISSPVYVNGTNPHYINLSYLASVPITGTDGTAGGFTAGATTNNPSLFLYLENIAGTTTTFSSGNYRSVKHLNVSNNYTYYIDNDGGGTTSYSVPVGNGYMFFFRGAASTLPSPYTSTAQPVPATLTTTGTLITGQVTVRPWFMPANTLSYSGIPPSTANVQGFNLVGNPYPSAINWDLFNTSSTTTGIYGTSLVGGTGTATIWVLDPVSKTYGTYISGSGGLGSASFVSNIIASGQGFFVRATSNTAKLIFNESAKSAASQNIGTKSLMSTSPLAETASPLQYLHLQIALSTSVYEQTLIRFNNSTSRTFSTDIDAWHVSGDGAVSLSSMTSDKVDVSINTVSLPAQLSQKVMLNVGATASGTYTLSLVDLVNVPKLYDLWLMDAYKKDSVNLRVSSTYSLNINKADTASFGQNRLTLVIRQNPALAYQLVNFSADKTQNGRNTQVNWTVLNEGNYTNFTVERSIDNGKSFKILGIVKADGSGTYGFFDKFPIMGENLYRLKQEDINNKITYSSVVAVLFSDHGNGDRVQVYPNPAKYFLSLNIAFTASDNPVYQILITNSTGLIVKQASTPKPVWNTNVSELLPGTYLIKVLNQKDKSFVGQTKFVKL